MGSLVRTILNSPACIRSQRLIVIPILLLASGLITAPAQMRIVTTVAGLTRVIVDDSSAAGAEAQAHPHPAADRPIPALHPEATWLQ